MKYYYFQVTSRHVTIEVIADNILQADAEFKMLTGHDPTRGLWAVTIGEPPGAVFR